MPDARLDITRELCPITYVRVKLALESLPDGAVLEVLLRGEEPLANVPRSAVADGHELLGLDAVEGAPHHRLTLRARHGR